MKLFKKIGIVISVMAVMILAFSVNASAATISDGIKAEITVESQDGDKASIEAVVKNANYYEIDGINCKLSVSDNAEISGENIKTDIKLSGEQSESLKADISLKESGETKPTEKATEAPTQEPTKKSETPTQPATQTKNSTTVKNAITTDNSTIKTGQQDYALPFAILFLLAFAAVLFVSFKKKNRRVISMTLCLCLTLSVCAAGISGVNAAEDDKISVIKDETVITLNGTDVTVTFTVEYPVQNEIHDNSLADLQALNGDSLDITYNDIGEISFLNGKYTNYKVINPETAMSSLQAVETLLNAKENDVSLIPVSVRTADNGDTYYTFQQNVGAVILSTSFITVGADKDGNTLCISSSIQPDAGFVNLEDNMITAEQAIAYADAVKEAGDERLDIEPVLDYCFKTAVGTSNLCWVVFYENKKNPGQDAEKAKYYKIYIDAATGEYVDVVYISDVTDYRTDDTVYNNDIYFKGVTTEMMSFKDYHENTVELPVAKSNSGKYYFIDTERKILCVDTQQSMKSNFIIPVKFEFSSADEVSPIFVSVFENMRKIYDNYAANGIKSLDGNGLPLMIGLGYQMYGKEVENACFAGNMYGWGVFMFSNFPISTGLDVAAHEFTHGVKGNITGAAAYQNVSGAVEESYADILGNLTELNIYPELLNSNGWCLAESTGSTIRDMSNPHNYYQPEYIGDKYYLMECDIPDLLNDRGGVHINNSILSKICYEMYVNGIDIKDNYNIWLDTFLVFNPNANYDDVLGYLKYIAERNGKEAYISLIQQLFEHANAVNAQTESWDGYAVPENCAKLTLKAHDFPEDLRWSGVIYFDNNRVYIYKDATESYRTFIDKVDIVLAIRYQDDVNSAPKDYYYAPLNEDGYNLRIDKDEIVVDFSYNDIT